MPMCAPWEERSCRLLGEEALKRLASSRVLVVGVGGVGGYAAETLCRTGIGHLTLIDADEVASSNINRQLIATHATLGQPKATLFAERFREINPECEVEARCEFLTPENVEEILAERYDFVVDAIDTVAPKTALLAACLRGRIPVVSSMGAGGRLDPAKVVYTDLWATRDDGLARAVRQRLKKLGLKRPLPVVASTEPPLASSIVSLEERNKRSSFGTTMAIPAIFGIWLGQYVVNRIIRQKTV